MKKKCPACEGVGVLKVGQPCWWCNGLGEYDEATISLLLNTDDTKRRYDGLGGIIVYPKRGENTPSPDDLTTPDNQYRHLGNVFGIPMVESSFMPPNTATFLTREAVEQAFAELRKRMMTLRGIKPAPTEEGYFVADLVAALTDGEPKQVRFVHWRTDYNNL